jgi:hypothetical protein
VTGQPIEEFQLPEVTYEALAGKAIGLTQPNRDPSKPIDLADYRLSLTHRDESVRDGTWWVRIRDTEHLVRIVDGGARAFGFLRVSANVLNAKPGAAAVVKRVAVSKKRPEVDAPAESADHVPDAPISASLPTPPKRVATGEVDDVRPPKRSSASSTLPIATPMNTNERPSASSTLLTVTPASRNERPSASSPLPIATPANTNEVETQQADEKILASLFFFNSLKITSPPRIQVALMSGYKNVKSAGFAKAMSRLKDEGNISCGSGTLSLTNKGRQGKSDMPNRPTDNNEVHRRFKTLLTSTCAKMFDLLADGKAQNKLDLMAALKYKNEKVRQ